MTLQKLIRSAIVWWSFGLGPVLAQDFGSAPANGTPAPQTLTVTVPNAPAGTPVMVLQYGVAFSLGAPSCAGSGTLTCTVPAAFAPKLPGLQRDAVVVKDSGGHVLTRQFVHGMGTGPLAAFYPSIISSILTDTQQIPTQASSGPATITLQNVTGVAVDPLGNVFAADSRANVIVRIDHTSGNPSVYASIPGANALALDPGGSLYVSTGSAGNQVVKVDAGTQAVSVVAGAGAAGSTGNGGPATLATLNNPVGVAVDTQGNLFIAESGNLDVRRVDAQTGTITAFAGTGSSGLSGDGGLATAATFEGIGGVAVDHLGNVSVSDSFADAIRWIDHATGFIWTLASPGNFGTAPGGGAPILGYLHSPQGLAVDSAGNVFVCGNGVQEIVISKNVSEGVAGGGAPGYNNIIGDGGPATSAVVGGSGVALDSAGNIYIADPGNNHIRKVTIAAGILLFPQTAVGSSSSAQTIQVENSGNATLTLGALGSSTAFPFAASPPNPCSPAGVLAPAATCSIGVMFAPPSPQRIAGALTVSSDSANQTGSLVQAALLGGPAIAITPSSIAFGNQSAGITSAPLQLTFTNTALSEPLQPFFSIAGANAADFVESDNCVAVLAPGASCTMSMFFTPGASGPRTATLTVNDLDDPIPQTVPLSGTGGAGAGCAVTSFSASPNPVASSAALGQTTVSAAAACGFDIRAGSASGTILFSGPAGGPHSSLASVADGTVYYLQPSGDTSALDTLGTLTIHVLAAGTSAQDFGSASVGFTSAPANVVFSLSGLAVTPSFSLRFGLDFTLASAACSGSGTVTCQVPVRFKPSAPGLRQDAVIARDQTGTILFEAFVSGIGLGPQWSITPGVLSTVAAGSGPPAGVAVDAANNVYFSENNNTFSNANTVSRITPAGSIALFAGTPSVVGGYFGDGGPAVDAGLSSPAGLALDGAGNLYIADSQNSRIRKVDSLSGVITTVAGRSSSAFAGDGGPALEASLNQPLAVAVDRAGNIFIADTQNNVVRRVDAVTGIIRTVAGTGVAGHSGDTGPATLAQLRQPAAIALDAQGNLLIGDNAGGGLWPSYVRRVDAATGVITTVAGSADAAALVIEGQPATSAPFGPIQGLAVNAAGNLIISDTNFNLVRMVDSFGNIRTVAGGKGPGGAALYSGDGGPSTGAAFAYPSGIALDTAGDLYVADGFYGGGEWGVRKVSAAPSPLAFTGSVSNPAPNQTISLNNTGSQPLTVAGINLRARVGRAFEPPDDAADFPMSTNCGASLAAAANCQVTLDFAPSSGSGARNATLEFATRQPVRGIGMGINRNPAVQLSGYVTPSTPCAAASFYVTPVAGGTAIVNVDASCNYDLRAASPAGTLLAQSHGQGAFPTGSLTLGGGLEFYLQKRGDTTPQGTLGAVLGSSCSVSGFSVTAALTPPAGAFIQVIAACNYDLRQGSPSGALVGQDYFQGVYFAASPPDGTVFYLQQSGNTTPAGTLAMATYSAAIPCYALRFSANPSPIVAAGLVGATTLTVLGSCAWDIRLGSPNGALLTSGPAGYTPNPATGNIVRNGTTFYLQRSGSTTPAGTMGKLTVLLVQP